MHLSLSESVPPGLPPSGPTLRRLGFHVDVGAYGHGRDRLRGR